MKFLMIIGGLVIVSLCIAGATWFATNLTIKTSEEKKEKE